MADPVKKYKADILKAVKSFDKQLIGPTLDILIDSSDGSSMNKMSKCIQAWVASPNLNEEQKNSLLRVMKENDIQFMFELVIKENESLKKRLSEAEKEILCVTQERDDLQERVNELDKPEEFDAQRLESQPIKRTRSYHESMVVGSHSRSSSSSSTTTDGGRGNGP
jgi:hypothetical protein